MRGFALLAGAICFPWLSAIAGDTGAKALVGTWAWCNHRHDMTVTYRVDGTYSRESQLANQTKPENTKGTWHIEGNDLIETSSQKDSEPVISVIRFMDQDRFELDGFMLFQRIPDTGKSQESAAIPD
jgi:hypothetical protein